MPATKDIAHIPANMTYEQAAAVPIAAITALQALRNMGEVEAGEKVLINGASGGVGTFAVQIAKSFGAEVTGVCSTRNMDMVRSIGADHVIDYTQEDFTLGGPRYDLILDQVANHSFSDCRRALTPQGIYIPNSGHSGLGFIIKAFVLSLFVRQQGGEFAEAFLDTLLQQVRLRQGRLARDSQKLLQCSSLLGLLQLRIEQPVAQLSPAAHERNQRQQQQEQADGQQQWPVHRSDIGQGAELIVDLFLHRVFPE